MKCEKCIKNNIGKTTYKHKRFDSGNHKESLEGNPINTSEGSKIIEINKNIKKSKGMKNVSSESGLSREDKFAK